MAEIQSITLNQWDSIGMRWDGSLEGEALLEDGGTIRFSYSHRTHRWRADTADKAVSAALRARVMAHVEYAIEQGSRAYSDALTGVSLSQP